MAGTILAIQPVPSTATNRQQQHQHLQQRHSAHDAVQYPDFLPPPGCVPVCMIGPHHLASAGAGPVAQLQALGDLCRFSNSPAHRLGPTTLSDPSHWLGSDGELDHLLYNYLFMVTLDKVMSFRDLDSNYLDG